MLLLLRFAAGAAAAWLTGSHKGRKRGGNLMKLLGIDLSRRREENREEERKETKESRRQREEKQAKEYFFHISFIHLPNKHNHASYRLQVTTTT